MKHPLVVRLRRAALFAAACATGAFASLTCGGTTGRDGLPEEDAPEAGGVASAVDASFPDDQGLFDVGISYVDRLLPDALPPVGLGADAAAGFPWPACPPFIPVGPDGTPVPAGNELDQLPAQYDDGAAVMAPDGSPCATYPWLGSTAVDECMTSLSSGWGQNDFPLLPPCSWCFDAGVAGQGPGAGTANYDLCIALYTCSMKTGCGAADHPAAACLCGDAAGTACVTAPTGPCLTEELAALQYRPDSVEQALSNYTQIDPAFLGYCGSALNYVFQSARANECFSASDASVNP